MNLNTQVEAIQAEITYVRAEQDKIKKSLQEREMKVNKAFQDLEAGFISLHKQQIQIMQLIQGSKDNIAVATSKVSTKKIH